MDVAGPTCPYCGKSSVRALGKDIYLRQPKLKDLKLFVCFPCDARVGVHKNSEEEWKPKGTLANPELRQLRMDAHKAFDPLWKKGKMSRGTAHRWLATRMGISSDECHIAMFDVEKCKKVLKLVEKFEGIL